MTDRSDHRDLSDDIVIKAAQTSKEIYVKIDSWHVIEHRKNSKIFQLVCHIICQFVGPHNPRHEAVNKVASKMKV